MILPSVRILCRPVVHEVTLALQLTEDHPAFAGHFPGVPVLPGVVQLDWAARLGTEYFDTGCPVSGNFQVKFRRTIRPGTDLKLILRYDSEKRSLFFEYRSQGETASSGRMVLE